MRYHSTRSTQKDLSFEDAVLRGLADDGGLFIPKDLPTIAPDTLKRWETLSFIPLAFEIFRLFISAEEISNADLMRICEKSFSSFTHEDIVPLKQLNADDQMFILELFHGPTFAFKDVALQFLGNLFEFFLARKDNHRITVVGATSGVISQVK